MDNERALVPSQDEELARILTLVEQAVTSQQSKRAYTRDVGSFILWYQGQGGGLNKATVHAYKTHLQALGKAAGTINRALSAIRKLAHEAADNGLLEASAAQAIARAKGVKRLGVRAGNWLSRDQAQQLLDAPDVQTLKGLRDRALLAVMLGAGLRRAEVASLTFEHVQQREAQWVIVDLLGKGGRIRSVPIEAWTKSALDAWAQAAGLEAGRIFRSIDKGGRVDGVSLSAQAIYDVIRHYAAGIGVTLAAHDTRRTFAKLAHRGGARLEQIQLSLGHASITTTERYLGTQQDWHDAPSKYLGLK